MFDMVFGYFIGLLLMASLVYMEIVLINEIRFYKETIKKRMHYFDEHRKKGVIYKVLINSSYKKLLRCVTEDIYAPCVIRMAIFNGFFIIIILIAICAIAYVLFVQ